MAELPELETIRRELEKEAVGKRFKAPEVTGTKAIKHNGIEEGVRQPPRGRQGEVGRPQGPSPRRQPRQRRAARHRPRPDGSAREGRPEGRRCRRAPPVVLSFTQGGQIRLVDPAGLAETFVVANDQLSTEVPEIAAGGLDPVADAVSWTSFARVLLARSVKLKAVLMDPEVVAAHRADLQRRDPLGGRSAPRPHLRLAVVAGDPPAVPGPRRDAARGRQAPRHHGRRPPVRRPLRQAGRLPGRAQGVRPRGRAVQRCRAADREGALREQAALLLRGLPGLTVCTGAPAVRRRPLTSPAVFLKTLTLKGFKSFADTTNLELEPGVTVVVGPNGSGKSNVVDAIGWVLGAQAPSAVRSQKMDDVIFAGTSKRPALGRAEVSLTIDNSAGHPADRLHRGHHHPHAVPVRRQRVRRSTACRAACSTCRSCSPTAAWVASST